MARAVAAEYLHDIKENGVGTLVLGCTHYPILREVIQQTMGEGVLLIDSGEATNGANKIAFTGATELPNHIREFGRNGAHFELNASLPDLQSLTARFDQPVSGLICGFLLSEQDCLPKHDSQEDEI